jgi:hypothetical protein
MTQTLDEAGRIVKRGGDVGRRRLTRRLMDEFAVATGLEGDAPPRRYLWTDAFAVCNFLELHHELGRARDLELAYRLIDQVHHVLGRHRPGDGREGWLSGLRDDEAEAHPTRGGLRIGKPLPERRADEPYDPRLEWERDGQYFHYLTQWIHALRRMSEETQEPIFRRWGMELARAARHAFVRPDPVTGARRMVWKTSVDMTRVLVPSTGHHDPLDAWVTYLELRAGGTPGERDGEATGLDEEIAEAAELCRGATWTTDDPLGAGALLVAGYRLYHLEARHGLAVQELSARVFEAAASSVSAVATGRSLRGAPDARLAFRELGFSIGLHAIERMRADFVGHRDPHIDDAIARIAKHTHLAHVIDEFWSAPAHRETHLFREHADINGVMLATSLAPDGYLGPPRV